MRVWSGHEWKRNHGNFHKFLYICFLKVNLLDRIKSVQVKKEIAEWLGRLLNRYDRTGKVMEIFC